jgi:hypothetical protein
MNSKLKIFRYLNREDSNLGTSVIVISDTLENAMILINEELFDMGYTFVDGNITITEIENNMVIDSFSGDCYF